MSNDQQSAISNPQSVPDRYSRQTIFPGIGVEGQRRLMASHVTLCGCGALGTVLASSLARAGAGHLRVVDRDFLELHNLQRQVLFDENDVHEGLPKAEAAARKLEAVNSSIHIEPVVTDIDHTNIIDLARDADLILDGTDNFETRYLINDAAVKLGKPWVYGGCIGSHGQVMTIVPGRTPCLRCVIESSPPPGMAPTCETAGILGPIVNIVASLQVTEALKILTGQLDAINRELIMIDVWDGTFKKLKIAGLLDAVDCPTCKRHNFEWLDGKLGSHTTSLCGRNAVQIAHRSAQRLSFETLERQLSPLGPVSYNRFMFKFDVDGYQFTVFPDGRAIIKGTNDINKARTLYAQYIGH
jgi:adenylyltransferase/sulfurtransferase